MANSRRWLYQSIVLVALLALGTGLPGRLPGNAGQGTDENAAWLGVEWAMQPVDPAQVAVLARELRSRRISTIYVFTTYLKQNGVWNPTYAYAKDFCAQMSLLAPECSVQAWVGLPLRQRTPLGVAGHVDLGDIATRQQVAEMAAHLVHDLGFDGVHLDPETVNSGDADLLLLLEETRLSLGPDALLSLATRRICPFRWEYAAEALGRWSWSATYYQQVAQRVDEIALMTYDSGLLLPGHYRYWTRVQVRRLQAALGENQVRLLIGVPASEEQTASHHPLAENMRSGLAGVLDAMGRDGCRGNVAGVAIYPYWDTDADEWTLYQSLWLGE